MAENDRNRPTNTRTDRKGGSNNMYIIGGVIIAVLVVLWLLFGFGGDDAEVTEGETGVVTETPEVSDEAVVDTAPAATEDDAAVIDGVDETEGN